MNRTLIYGGPRRDFAWFVGALLAAEDRLLAERVSAVAGIAPYTHWVNVVRLATTGTYPSGKALDRYPVPACFHAFSV